MTYMPGDEYELSLEGLIGTAVFTGFICLLILMASSLGAFDAANAKKLSEEAVNEHYFHEFPLKGFD